MSAASSTFACATCGKEYRWKPEMAGRRAKCKCGAAVEVPATDPAAAPPPPPEPEAEPSFDDVFALAAESPTEEPDAPPVRPAPHTASPPPKSAKIVPATSSGVPIPRRAKLDNTPSVFERSQNVWKGIGYAFLGVILSGYGYYEFHILARLEEEGGRHRMRAWIRLIYEIGGKWAVLVILGGLGVLVLLFGVMVVLGKADPNTDES